jgi:hypothetical protein
MYSEKNTRLYLELIYHLTIVAFITIMAVGYLRINHAAKRLGFNSLRQMFSMLSNSQNRNQNFGEGRNRDAGFPLLLTTLLLKDVQLRKDRLQMLRYHDQLGK